MAHLYQQIFDTMVEDILVEFKHFLNPGVNLNLPLHLLLIYFCPEKGPSVSS